RDRFVPLTCPFEIGTAASRVLFSSFGGQSFEFGQVLEVLLPAGSPLRGDEVRQGANGDVHVIDVDHHGSRNEGLVGVALEAVDAEHDVQIAEARDEPDRQRVAEEVTGLQSAIDPWTLDAIVDPPARTQGVEGVSEALEV